MSSKEAPYATMHDLPTYQEREKVGSAPWEKDQRPAPSSRGPHFEPCFYPSSQTAPFATNDNLPIPRQNADLPVKHSIWPRISSAQRQSTSDDQWRRDSRKMVTSAPWDRDESHYSAKIRCGNTGSGRTAPFATEFNNNKK